MVNTFSVQARVTFGTIHANTKTSRVINIKEHIQHNQPSCHIMSWKITKIDFEYHTENKHTYSPSTSLDNHHYQKQHVLKMVFFLSRCHSFLRRTALTATTGFPEPQHGQPGDFSPGWLDFWYFQVPICGSPTRHGQHPNRSAKMICPTHSFTS